MESLQGHKVVVTGGSRGIGLGIVEALVDRQARVTIVAREPQGLSAVSARLGVATWQGDVTDALVARDVLREVRPSVLVLNAGEIGPMGPLHELTWDDFSRTWNTDVKAGLLWVQEALRLPLEKGSRVVIASSGAAIAGSPLSGGYAGAKRMLWLMANYANGCSAELERGIRFQVIVPRQMSGETALGRAAAEAYAKKQGVTLEAFLAGFGKQMPPRQIGEHVATILTDGQYESGVAFGLKGDTGIVSLDA